MPGSDTSTLAVHAEPVSFVSDGLELRGVLRVTAATGPLPGLALTGPFTGVHDQVVGTYAERLARAGFATLAFDHRGFGMSEGRRGHEDSQGKLADLRAAIGLLAAHPRIGADRIGLVGICLGGGYALRAAAADPRVRAVIGIAGAYNSPAWIAARMGLDTYRSSLTTLVARYDEYLPAVAPEHGEAAMSGDEPYAYYGAARSTSTQWANQVTRGSLHALMTFDALGAAPLLAATPSLIAHGRHDDYCAPELAAEVDAQTPGVKQLLWLDCTQHIDFYDTEPHVSDAVHATTEFLHQHLGEQAAL